ncbi:MAG TPA: hypothetical protein VJP77_08785 [Planctomycetota bacterium]|nr:hypothetical protein [Planctomycetota bacterium]
MASGVGLGLATLFAVGLAAVLLHQDDGEEYGWTSFVLSGCVGLEFRKAYESALQSEGSGVAWERAIEVLDPRSASREARKRIRLGRDGAARIAVLYTPSGPVAVLYADGASAAVWSREHVVRIAAAPDDLAWLRAEPELRWVPLAGRRAKR